MQMNSKLEYFLKHSPANGHADMIEAYTKLNNAGWATALVLDGIIRFNNHEHHKAAGAKDMRTNDDVKELPAPISVLLMYRLQTNEQFASSVTQGIGLTHMIDMLIALRGGK